MNRQSRRITRGLRYIRCHRARSTWQGNDTFPGEDQSWASDNRHVTLIMDNAIYVIDTRLDRRRRLVSGSGKVGQSNWSPILDDGFPQRHRIPEHGNEPNSK